MGRAKKFIPGYVYKKWVIVAEGEPAGKNRTVVCKCLACGEVKTIRTDRISAGVAKNCECGQRVPMTLPQNKGIACRSRLKTCLKSAGGYCCYFCEKKHECADACLNMPTKCGSYYIHNDVEKAPEKTVEEEPRHGLLHWREG